MASGGRDGRSGGLNRRGGQGGPPLASIESLLSYEAKSTPRSEYGQLGSGPGSLNNSLASIKRIKTMK